VLKKVPRVAEPLVYDLAEFCAAHKLSRSSFYELAREGQAPKIFKIGSSIRITQESAAAWRAQREAEAAAQPTAKKVKEEEAA
jgi:predicted DNA-binding transcriptional regulator AlpA